MSAWDDAREKFWKFNNFKNFWKIREIKAWMQFSNAWIEKIQNFKKKKKRIEIKNFRLSEMRINPLTIIEFLRC